MACARNVGPVISRSRSPVVAERFRSPVCQVNEEHAAQCLPVQWHATFAHALPRPLARDIPRATKSRLSRRTVQVTLKYHQALFNLRSGLCACVRRWSRCSQMLPIQRRQPDSRQTCGDSFVHSNAVSLSAVGARHASRGLMRTVGRQHEVPFLAVADRLSSPGILIRPNSGLDQHYDDIN